MTELAHRVWHQLGRIGLDVLTTLADYAVRLSWAVTVLFVAIYLIRRASRRLEAQLRRRKHIRGNLPELVANVFTIGGYVITGILLLRTLGASSTALVTSVGLVTAAISLSLQDVLKNFVAGLYLLAEQPFRLGDRIRVLGEDGTVERVDIRTTQIRNQRAEQILIPNSKVFTEIVGNRSTFRLQQIVVLATGVPLPARQATTATTEVIKSFTGPSGVDPVVEVIKAGPESVDVRAKILFGSDAVAGHDIVLALHDRFPSATVALVET